MHAVERSLGVQRGRLKLWALDGNRVPGNDDGEKGKGFVIDTVCTK